MLRVGLTGELGSGKSTVARLLAERGAIVLSSDEMARGMMQPGQAVYQTIADRFGPSILLPDSQLNRPELARLAFDPEHPRVEELNAIVHPAVLAEQEREVAAIAGTHPEAMVVVESALLFTTRHAGNEPWRKRFDRIVLVTAPDDVKIARFMERTAASRKDALARLAAQRIPASLTQDCIVIENASDLQALTYRTEEVFQELRREMDHVQH